MGKTSIVLFNCSGSGQMVCRRKRKLRHQQPEWTRTLKLVRYESVFLTRSSLLGAKVRMQKSTAPTSYQPANGKAVQYSGKTALTHPMPYFLMALSGRWLPKSAICLARSRDGVLVKRKDFLWRRC